MSIQKKLVWFLFLGLLGSGFAACELANGLPIFLTGKDKAKSLCNTRLAFSPIKRAECLEVVQAGEFFDIEAVEVCDTIHADGDFNDCLATIRDIEFDSDDIDACSELWSFWSNDFYDSSVIDCFEGRGDPIH